MSYNDPYGRYPNSYGSNSYSNDVLLEHDYPRQVMHGYLETRKSW